MNWVDAVIVIVVAVAAYSSMRTGFLRQAFSVIGFVVGVYAALTHHGTVARVLLGSSDDSAVATIIAFLMILIGAWFASAALATMAYRALKASGLAWADHLIGMVIGLCAGLLFTVCFLLLFVRIPLFGISAAVQQSVLASYIFKVLPHLRQLLPSDLRILTTV
jgi:membrane protein required for colicin V production